MKELIKSLLLVTLTISALLLTGAIFMDEAPVSTPETPELKIDLMKLIRPQNYIFSFGDLYIKVYEDRYQGVAVRSKLESVFYGFIDESINSSEKLKIGDVSKKEWEELIRRKSVQINFPATLPLNDLIKLNNYNVDSDTDNNVTTLLLLLNVKDAIYIYDEIQDNYYKLSGASASNWIEDVFEAVDEAKIEDVDGYKTLENRYALTQTALRKYNLPEGNMILIPVSDTISYPKYGVVKEINLSQTSTRLREYALTIFDNDLSFVKPSVYSDDEIIYMYGYGEKVFKYNVDGSLEYTEKVNAGEKAAIDFKEGLTTSVHQIDKFRALDSNSAISANQYLSGFQRIETKNTIETVYYFNYAKDGIPLYNPDVKGGHLIEVHFMNNELYKIKKNYRFVATSGYDANRESKKFSDIVKANKIWFELGYKEDRPLSTVEPIDFFSMSLQEMTMLEIKYLVIDDEIIPTWFVKVADTEYGINLTNDKIIMKNGQVFKDGLEAN